MCEADLDNSGLVDFVDFLLCRSVFATNNADADFDGSGLVDFGDFNLFRGMFATNPGPSALVP